MVLGLFLPWTIIGIIRDSDSPNNIMIPTIAMPLAAVAASWLPLPDAVNTILKVHIYDWKLLGAVPEKLEAYYNYIAALIEKGYTFAIPNFQMLEGLTDTAAKLNCIWNNFLFVFIYPYITMGSLLWKWLAKLFMEYQLLYAIMLVWMIVCIIISALTLFQTTVIGINISHTIFWFNHRDERVTLGSDFQFHKYDPSPLRMLSDWRHGMVIGSAFIPWGFFKKSISYLANIILCITYSDEYPWA